MCVNADEYNIVCQMQVVDREVFFYLAQRTDSRGFIGKKCRVSYGGMALDLSERDSPGRRTSLWIVTSNDIRNSVRRLISAGILRCESVSSRTNQLILSRVFFANSSNEDRSVQKQVTRRLPDRLPGHENNNVTNINNIDDVKEIGYQTNKREVTTTNIHQLHHRSDETIFVMSGKWLPDEQRLRVSLFNVFGSKFTIGDIDPMWVEEFRLYWEARGIKLSQAAWMKKFTQLIIIYLQIPGEFERRHGVRKRDYQNGSTHVERSSKQLPEWARPPRDDDALLNWMRKHGFGDGPAGVSVDGTRGWLRRQIDLRMAENNLPKIVH